LSLAWHIATSFKADQNRCVGGGRPEHGLDCQGGGRTAAGRHPMAPALCRSGLPEFYHQEREVQRATGVGRSPLKVLADAKRKPKKLLVDAASHGAEIRGGFGNNCSVSARSAMGGWCKPLSRRGRRQRVPVGPGPCLSGVPCRLPSVQGRGIVI
jgi:hypothetical protein